LGVKSSAFRNFSGSVFVIEESTGNLKNSTFSYSGKGVFVRLDSDISIEESTFEDCDSKEVSLFTDGGAIKIDNSNATISESNFNNNTAINGGAIYLT
jgi:hypothetical protein